MERQEPGLKSSLLARLHLQLPDRLQTLSGGTKKEQSPFSHLPPPHRYQRMGQRHPQCCLVSLSVRCLQGCLYVRNRACPLFAVGESGADSLKLRQARHICGQCMEQVCIWCVWCMWGSDWVWYKEKAAVQLRTSMIPWAVRHRKTATAPRALWGIIQTYSMYGMEGHKEIQVLCGVLERDEDRKSQSNQKRTNELHGLST